MPRSSTGKKIVVTHNYRYAPKHQKIKELLMSGEIGKLTSVDFTWFLDTTHGADYFRRWHRLRAKSGSLWVHKASHHFDLINWWIDAEPVQVSALGSLANYGKSGPFRHTNCRTCPHKSDCSYYWDITKSPNLVGALQRLRIGRRLSARWLRLQGRHRHLRHDERRRPLSNGVNMSYSVNTFMPVEGYYLAFNGTKGRLEIRDYEKPGLGPGRGHRDLCDEELRSAREGRCCRAKPKATVAAISGCAI